MSMINCLAAGVYNPFVVLCVFDYTDHCFNGGKKDGEYIAALFLGVIAKLDATEDAHVSSFGPHYSCDKIIHFISSTVQTLGEEICWGD